MRIASAFDRPLGGFYKKPEPPEPKPNDSKYSVERLNTLLDAGIVARATIRAIGDQVSDCANALARLKADLQIHEHTERANGGRAADAMYERAIALTQELKRLRARHEQAISELSPQVQLAESCEIFAQKKRIATASRIAQEGPSLVG